jgi:hypothetical protein
VQKRWITDVVSRRVAAWLAVQGPIAGKELHVESAPNIAEVGPSGLSLINAQGLGARLDEGQQALLSQARKTIDAVFRSADDSLAVLTAQKQFGIPLIERGDKQDNGNSGGGGGVELMLLSDGVVALQRCFERQLLQRYVGEELLHALEQHRELVHTAVPAEGAAVHAFHLTQGGNLVGMGTLLASVAGAAFSTSSVVMRLSRYAATIENIELREAVKQIGAQVIEALRGEKSPDGKVILANARQMLGLTLLEKETVRSAELLREMNKLCQKSPVWAVKGEKGRYPDLALAEIYHFRVDGLRKESLAAFGRFLEILDQLAYEGERASMPHVAQGRVGYVVAGLGAPLVHGASNELVSLVREAIATIKQAPVTVEKGSLFA